MMLAPHYSSPRVFVVSFILSYLYSHVSDVETTCLFPHVYVYLYCCTFAPSRIRIITSYIDLLHYVENKIVLYFGMFECVLNIMFQAYL